MFAGADKKPIGGHVMVMVFTFHSEEAKVERQD